MDAKDVIVTPCYPSQPSTSAIIVCPGGGYARLADHEGVPVGKWLATLGITAFVLRYRHGPEHHHPTPMSDLAWAVRQARQPFGFSPSGFHRVGVLGFSAGGHLAATLSTQAPDDAARPDAAILCYPVITMADPHAHAGSRENLLGRSPSQALIAQMSADQRVTAHTPPTFIWHTADDVAVPVENALLYAAALRANNVPFELHVYAHGPHGVGLASDDPILRTWTDRCADWLKGRGF